MNFKIVGKIEGEKTFAAGTGIREIARLRRIYGNGRWRKRKGVATIEFSDGTTHRAELHWYEATGIGRKEYKNQAIDGMSHGTIEICNLHREFRLSRLAREAENLSGSPGCYRSED